MRYVDKEAKPLKVLIKDSLLVFISVVAGSFILEQVKPVIDENLTQANPAAFTDNPPF
jgi:hypothetical protein